MIRTVTRRTPAFYRKGYAISQAEIRFSRLIRNNSAGKNLSWMATILLFSSEYKLNKPCLFCRDCWVLEGESGETGMKYILTTIGFAFLFAAPIFAAEDSLLARITVYWPGEGQVRACSNGARLRANHCAVDPKRIPFGSRVLFPDAICTAVDSGPAVVSRKAARVTGRTASQRNAVVIDRFFESREAALAWERSHPHFMTVRIVQSESREELKMSKPEMPTSETRTASLPETKKLEQRVNADGTAIAGPIDPLMRSARRRAL